MSLFTAEQKRRLNDYFPSIGDRDPGMGTGGLLGLIESVLSSTASGQGASQVGVEDAAANFAAADLEGVLAEMGAAGAAVSAALSAGVVGGVRLCQVDLTLGGEVANVVPVTINVTNMDGSALSRAQRLLCQVFDTTGGLNPAAFTCIEAGAGSQVHPVAAAATSLIETDANGDAILNVTDVVGASGSTVLLVVTPVSTPVDVPGFARAVQIAFD